MTPIANAGAYFEIPVLDLERAMQFYQKVFQVDFQKMTVDGYEMALFPFQENCPGITGALAKGDVYQPSKEGTLIYLRSFDIDKTLASVTANGGEILYPNTSNGDWGFVAEFQDSEGNRVGLHEPLK